MDSAHLGGREMYLLDIEESMERHPVKSIAIKSAAALLCAVMACAGSAQSPSRTNADIPMCKAGDISLATDDENGAFNGMSHSGTLLVLRNLSPAACRVALRPEITFLSGQEPLPIHLEIPGAKFMHPGPVLVPVVIAPDAEVTSKLRWVSGEVYEQSSCLSPTTIAVKIGEGTQRVNLAATICGDKTKGVTFQATPLAADPAYRGK